LLARVLDSEEAVVDEEDDLVDVAEVELLIAMSANSAAVEEEVVVVEDSAAALADPLNHPTAAAVMVEVLLMEVLPLTAVVVVEAMATLLEVVPVANPGGNSSTQRRLFVPSRSLFGLVIIDWTGTRASMGNRLVSKLG
jgi:hypothetical protein